MKPGRIVIVNDEGHTLFDLTIWYLLFLSEHGPKNVAGFSVSEVHRCRIFIDGEEIEPLSIFKDFDDVDDE